VVGALLVFKLGVALALAWIRSDWLKWQAGEADIELLGGPTQAFVVAFGVGLLVAAGSIALGFFSPSRQEEARVRSERQRENRELLEERVVQSDEILRQELAIQRAGFLAMAAAYWQAFQNAWAPELPLPSYVGNELDLPACETAEFLRPDPAQTDPCYSEPAAPVAGRSAVSRSSDGRSSDDRSAGGTR
jgi:hypothetical protein